MVACNKSAACETTIELILLLKPRLHVKECAHEGLPDTLVICVGAELVFKEPR